MSKKRTAPEKKVPEKKVPERKNPEINLPEIVSGQVQVSLPVTCVQKSMDFTDLQILKVFIAGLWHLGYGSVIPNLDAMTADGSLTGTMQPTLTISENNLDRSEANISWYENLPGK